MGWATRIASSAGGAGRARCPQRAAHAVERPKRRAETDAPYRTKVSSIPSPRQQENVRVFPHRGDVVVLRSLSLHGCAELEPLRAATIGDLIWCALIGRTDVKISAPSRWGPDYRMDRMRSRPALCLRALRILNPVNPVHPVCSLRSLTHQRVRVPPRQ